MTTTRNMLAPLRPAARALAGIGRSLLPGSPAEAAAYLREALVIAQRIGSLEAVRIQDTLTEHGL